MFVFIIKVLFSHILVFDDKLGFFASFWFNMSCFWLFMINFVYFALPEFVISHFGLSWLILTHIISLLDLTQQVPTIYQKPQISGFWKHIPQELFDGSQHRIEQYRSGLRGECSIWHLWHSGFGIS